MDEQRQDDQLEPTYSSSVRYGDLPGAMYDKERGGGEKGPERSVLMARYDELLICNNSISVICLHTVKCLNSSI